MKYEKGHDANLSNSKKAKLDKKILKKYPSPDLSKMYSLRTDWRTVYYFHTKSKMNNKIRQLKADGIEFEIL